MRRPFWLTRFRAARIAREIDDELRFHYDMRVAEYQRAGFSPRAARAKARARFGAYDEVAADCHAVYRIPNVPSVGGVVMESLWQDLKYAMRSLRREPSFSVIAVATLAIGIGANALIFSAVHSTLLRPVPFPGGERFAWLYHQRAGGAMRVTPTADALSAWRERGTTFDVIASYGYREFLIDRNGEPDRLSAAAVSTDLIRLLDLRPAHGRLFVPTDTVTGHDRVVALSHGYWRREFGGDAEVLGRVMSLDGAPYTIVGVLPPIADVFFRGADRPIWVPASSGNSIVIRMREGVTVDEVRADLQRIQDARLPNATAVPDAWPVTLRRPEEGVADDLRAGLWTLLGAVGLVLMVACANVANMVLARGASRRQELAIRAAVGGSRGRLLRQMLVEGLVLTVAAAAVGIGLAAGGRSLLIHNLPDGLELLRTMRIQGTVLLGVVAIAGLTGIGFGLVPLRQVFRLDLVAIRGDGGTPRAGRMRQILVAVEVALALMLFVGAGLLINSFLRLQRVDHGFDPDNLVTFQVRLPESRYPGDTQIEVFADDLVGRIRQLPMVEAAARGTVGRWFGFSESTIFTEDDPTADPPRRPVRLNLVSNDYFRAVGMPMRQGREFNETELNAESQVLIVNEAFRRAFWPGEDAIGRRLRFTADGDPYTVVGVVEDVRVSGLHDDPDELQMYHPYGTFRGMRLQTMVVRGRGEPDHFLPLLRGQVWSLDPRLPLRNLDVVTTILADAIARPKFNAYLLTALALTALVLASVGVYGIITLSIAQRTREFGIRMALGAGPRDLLRHVIGFGMGPVGIGVGLGLAGALGLTRFIESLLYEVNPADPATLVVVVAVLVSVGLVACYVPARRALRLDPAGTLRAE